MRKTLGGDRLGSGQKMKVDLHGYERSNHDLSYKWRSTMAPGTLVPFMCKVALPGDTWDITLNAEILTLPTLGPLFGEFKAQFDIFECPVRLYHGALHNNKLGIGLNMSQIIMPTIALQANTNTPAQTALDWDNTQINPSCILSYLGIRGVGANVASEPVPRNFNAIPLLAYYDIFKNYYSNKMEEFCYMVHTNPEPIAETIDNVEFTIPTDEGPVIIAVGSQPINVIGAWQFQIHYTGTIPQDWAIILETSQGNFPISYFGLDSETGGFWPINRTGNITVYGWRYATANDGLYTSPQLQEFYLSGMDEMREQMLVQTIQNPTINVDVLTVADTLTVDSPYASLLDPSYGTAYAFTQEGLMVKTYQSDLLNNWLNMDYLDETGGINDITKIITTGGSFTLDTLLLNRKIYDFLNRIIVSGGTYQDWIEVTYDSELYVQTETPMYHGGMSREVAFQEVISLAQSPQAQGATPNQPLGTLAGRGKFTPGQKGGAITIHVKEPSYIIGIVSLTPRLDYSQGNSWDTYAITTMDDFHKPALDEIGFQELICEQMAWWSTYWDGGEWVQSAAGKQPAWVNYMTSVNETRGNFAALYNSMFMTLNRRYQMQTSSEVTSIADLTTYIDPTHYNFIFAQTSLDAQNFWTQIAVNCMVRRKMSAKIMPNL